MNVNFMLKKQKLENKGEPRQKFFVSNIPHTTSAEELESFIRENGIKNDIKIRLAMRVKSNENKGFGIITIDASFTNEMLALNNATVGHREINVKLDDPEVKKTKNREDWSGAQPTKRCFRCGECHDPKKCTNARICYRCKSTDHLSSECEKKHLKR